MDTGSIEVQIVSMKVLNKTEDLPFLPYSRATDVSNIVTLTTEINAEEGGECPGIPHP